MKSSVLPGRLGPGRVARGKWLRLVLGELTNTFAEGGEGRGLSSAVIKLPKMLWMYNSLTVSHIPWGNYNDLTATSLESWLIRGIIPTWPYFRLVNYCNLPSHIPHVYCLQCVQMIFQWCDVSQCACLEQSLVAS